MKPRFINKTDEITQFVCKSDRTTLNNLVGNASSELVSRKCEQMDPVFRVVLLFGLIGITLATASTKDKPSNKVRFTQMERDGLRWVDSYSEADSAPLAPVCSPPVALAQQRKAPANLRNCGQIVDHAEADTESRNSWQFWGMTKPYWPQICLPQQLFKVLAACSDRTNSARWISQEWFWTPFSVNQICNLMEHFTTPEYQEIFILHRAWRLFMAMYGHNGLMCRYMAILIYL